MPRNRHKKKGPKPSSPVSEPKRQASRSPTQREDAVAHIEALLSKRKTVEALEYMDKLPGKLSNEPEIRLMYALALLEYGDFEQAGQVLRDLERKNPRFLPLYPILAGWHMTQDMPAHAYRALNKVLNNPQYDQTADTLQDMADAAQIMLKQLAASFGVTFSKAEQASWYHERAQLALIDHNLVEMERMAGEALKIIPAWSSPRNNYSHALYFSGRTTDALAQAERVVSNDPQNIHGLKNLTLFHYGLGQVDKAQEYANRLFEIVSTMKERGFENDILITALSVIEDTDRLWTLAQKYLQKHSDALISRSWHCLAVAATRMGRLKEAKNLLGRAASQEELKLTTDLMNDIEEAIKNKSARLLWPPTYPGMELFLSERLVIEWGKIIEKVEDEKPTPRQQGQINAFMEKYPFVLHGFKKMLWSKDSSWLGASSLVALNRPEADAEVLRFATSDWGANDSRMEAAMILSKAGRYQLDKPLKFWDAHKGEWHEVQMFSQQIQEVEYDIKPKTAELIEEARRAKEPQETIALLRKAVEDDPTCAMALHNLGAVMMHQGENEEGEGLMRRSIEVDPTYMFGYANLGLLEAQRGNKEAALDLLGNVSRAKIIAPNTAALANLAYATLALAEEDIEGARRHFDLAEKFHPQNAALEAFRERLELLEKFSGIKDSLRDFQIRSANRHHRTMLNTPLSETTDLETCLSKTTSEQLSEICKIWGVQSYGKKNDKIERLAPRILDSEILDDVVAEISLEEREALEAVNDQGGWMPWQEFIGRYGDDMDESPSWHYQEPQSIPGRLKRAGLLFVGKLNRQEVAFIPVDLRPLLREALNKR